MRELLLDLVDTAAGRCEYADVRHVRSRSERLVVRNGSLEQSGTGESAGIGVRVRAGGAWGFAATRDTSRAAAEAALTRALDLLAAQPAAPGSPLAPEPTAQGSWQSPCARDPFAVDLDEKLAVLARTDAVLRSQPGVAVASAGFTAFETEKLFASTEGALCEQRLVECGGGMTAIAVAGDDAQVRSYPASHGGDVALAGYEHFEQLALPDTAAAVAEEAAALLTAAPCPAEQRDLILAREQLGLQIHESIGHALELDRVLGREASYAGTSYAAAPDRGSLRIGSPLMNVTADATTAGGLGTFRWDDEGVDAQSVPLVRDGVLSEFLSSRETAAEIGVGRSAGCMRAAGFARQPVVRMTNVNLEPGDAGSLEDLIAATDRGLLIETNRSWSIDDRRLQFRFEGEAGWLIDGGRRTRLVKNPSYAGRTPDFWGRLDAVCGPDAWSLASVLNCGKGEPGQSIHCSHGSAPARFRGVEVGVA